MPRDRFEQAVKKIANELGVLNDSSVDHLDVHWALYELHQHVHYRHPNVSIFASHRGCEQSIQFACGVIQNLEGLMLGSRKLSFDQSVIAVSYIEFLIDEFCPEISRKHAASLALASA